jgi:PKD repeat protein
MKTNTSKFFKKAILLFGAFFLITFLSCKDEEPGPDPIASFQYAISETNFLEVTFTNYSQNATTYSWDFGDGETSTEQDPVHIYDAEGDYTVILTATNKDGASHSYPETITITDPYEAYKLLTGEVSKTWKLFREGTSMSAGPNPDDPAGWWPGLQNDGERPCLYYQEFTFHFDSTYVFDDKGMFWGEYGVFDGQWNFEICFEAIAANMINLDGIDVSAWLSGTHEFTYDPSAGTATLTGLGAWIGIPKLGTSDYTTVPVASVTFNLSITQETGYDLMTVVFDYGDGNAGGGGYWKIVYASYSDPTLEPEVVEEQEPYGEDLEDLTPTEMWNTFAATDDFVLLDTAAVYPGTGVAANGLTLTIGVDDPDGGETAVGKYERYGMYQELQFQMDYDIQFDNFTTVSLDVYIPSSNDFTGTLTKNIAIIIGEASQTEQWWTAHIQYDVNPDDVVLDEWQTWTFQLDSPTSGPGFENYTPFDRDDLDFFAISIGGGGHTATGTFYIRNFMFE